MVLSMNSPASQGSRRPSVVSLTRSGESIRSGYVLAGGEFPEEPWFSKVLYEYLLCGCLCDSRQFPGAQLTEEEVEFLRTYRQSMDRPFNSKNPDHEMLLTSIWRNTFPETELPAEIDPKWTSLGFQSSNPRTDIRTGIHSLEAMEYMSRVHVVEFRRIVCEASDPQSEYPFAASCVSIAFSLVIFFKLNLRTSVNPSSSTIGGNRYAVKQFVRLSMHHRDFFNELFAYMVMRVHKEWMTQEPGQFDIHYFAAAQNAAVEALTTLFNKKRVTCDLSPLLNS